MIPAFTEKLTNAEQRRMNRCPVECSRLDVKIRNLADYITTMSMPGPLWFRGHADIAWRLAPSALRYDDEDHRRYAVGLISEFKRVGEIKLMRPPQWNEDLKWVQLAQHYGVPTRLLDWTESPVIALYFACLTTENDGAVFVMNPIDLNRASFPQKPRVFNLQLDEATISKYLVGELKGKRRLKTIAVSPVWNSERLMVQKGAFTLHGTEYDLDDQQAPSLVAVPVPRDSKARLREDLERFGIDEMTMFPELEHACNFLKRRARLC